MLVQTVPAGCVQWEGKRVAVTSQRRMCIRSASMSHLSFPTWLTCLLDLTPFHWHTILVRGDELDGSFLWGLSHGWLRRENPIGVVEFGGWAGSPLGLLVGVCPRIEAASCGNLQDGFA